MSSSITEAARDYAHKRLNEDLPGTYVYHSWSHTDYVHRKATKFAENEDVSDEQMEILELAVYFHDLGYTEGTEGHEERSAEEAQTFLEGHGYPAEKIEEVKNLILKTELNFDDDFTLLEGIIADADCAHLARNKYMEQSELLKKEIELTQGISHTEVEWLDKNIEFFTKVHNFKTPYVIKNLGPKKHKNLLDLMDRKQKIETKKQMRKLGRGVETLFRTQLKNHIDLSAIADSKANILLSINAIIISIALSGIMPKLDNASNSFLIIPTFTLLVFSVITIVLSILATRPQITKGTITRDDIINDRTNILFFGNFYRLSLKDFEWGIDHLKEDQDALYKSLTKDLYYLGLVLERKYRLLKITYNVFMVGLIVSIIAFGVSFAVSMPEDISF